MRVSNISGKWVDMESSNGFKVKVIGKRKREVGLVIPATFIAHTENKRTAEIFDTELAKRRKMFTKFELKHKPKKFLEHSLGLT